ncbi:MAG: D-2-hydroxyacid dehydrogenase [Chloroflexota bacterium]
MAQEGRCMSEGKQEEIRVVVAADFSDRLIEQLQSVSDRLMIERRFPDVPASAYAEAEVLYSIRHFPEPSQAPRLRWIQLHFAGMDRVVDKPIVQAEDVEVTSASGIHAVPIAEYCLSMMLAWEYQLPKLLTLKASVEWPQNQYEIFRPHGLRGKTLGIAGYGSIGRELARLAHEMGMSVVATRRNLRGSMEDEGYMEPHTGDPTGDIPDRLYPPEATASMASVCDYLVVAVPLTPETHHLINEAVLSKMKSTAVLINVARGEVIDEAALISALAAEKIGGASLDVFEQEPLPPTSPLWNLDNVIISPHIAGNNTRYHERAAALFAENLRRYVENQPLLNRLDRQRGY